MSRKFTIETKPYDDIRIYRQKNIEILSGITVLIGCNGSGKTTLIKTMKSQLKEEKIPYINFDNLHDGGLNSKNEAFYNEDFKLGASMLCSSEGENISLNLIQLGKKIVPFMKYGKIPKSRKEIVFDFLSDKEESEKEISKERWIFLDAIDSGFSIDNIMEVKEYFLKKILKHNFGNEVYIIVSANSFEMANGEQCLDIYNGEYVYFSEYDEYKQFILKSRERKDKRYK